MPTVKKEKRYINLACSFGRKFAPRRGICKLTNYCLTYSVLFGIGPINGSLLSSSLPALLFFRSSRYPSPASSHLTLTEEIQKRLATWWVNRELPPLSNVYTAQEGCQEPFANYESGGAVRQRPWSERRPWRIGVQWVMCQVLLARQDEVVWEDEVIWRSRRDRILISSKSEQTNRFFGCCVTFNMV